MNSQAQLMPLDDRAIGFLLQEDNCGVSANGVGVQFFDGSKLRKDDGSVDMDYIIDGMSGR